MTSWRFESIPRLLSKRGRTIGFHSVKLRKQCYDTNFSRIVLSHYKSVLGKVRSISDRISVVKEKIGEKSAKDAYFTQNMEKAIKIPKLDH